MKKHYLVAENASSILCFNIVILHNYDMRVRSTLLNKRNEVIIALNENQNHKRKNSEQNGIGPYCETEWDKEKGNARNK